MRRKADHSPTDASVTRRGAVAIVAGTAAFAPSSARSVEARGETTRSEKTNLRAIAFDAFPVFDPRSILALARQYFPDKGDQLVPMWTSKLFGYTWLATAADRYRPFETLADASLRFVATSLHVDLPDRVRIELVGAYSQLDVWPDARAALRNLKDAGLRLVFLSNLSEATLQANMRRAGIAEVFDAALSTDRVRHYKPSPLAYAMAMDALGLPKNEIGFAAFGGWDAAGATWFGYRTAWINRLGAPAEPFDTRPAVVAAGMDGVLALAGLTPP